MPRAKLNYDSGQVKNIHYGDILTKFDSVINISEEDVPYITDGIPEDYCKNLLKNGDVIFADTAEDETAGKAIEISGIIDNFVVSGLHTLAARPHIKFASNYLGYYLNSISYHKQLLKFMQGIKVLSISKRNLAKTIIKYPQKITEQEKIGSFFKHIDSLITLHQRKLKILKQLKQAMLQKMFPAKDKKVPELRFAGFKNEWEQRKLGEVSTISAGGDVNKEKLKSKGKYPVIANALTKDGILGYYDDDFRIKAPAVTVTGRGDVGFAKARTVDFTPVVRLLSVKSDNNINFLENSINNHGVLVESTGVPQLTAPQLGNYRIYFPSFNEQEKIGTFFKILDDTIALHQSKLEKLKSLKQVYLQKMFI